MPDPKEAPTRLLLVELFLEHRRVGTIASVLASRGVRTRSGARFSETTIVRLLREPAPSVVPDDLHAECQALLASRERGTRPAKMPAHLFVGVARCACGGVLQVPTSNSAKYVCPACHRKAVADDLEALFRHELANLKLANRGEEFDLHATWPHLTFEEKRVLVEHLVERIVVGDGTITIWLYTLRSPSKEAVDSHRTGDAVEAQPAVARSVGNTALGNVPLDQLLTRKQLKGLVPISDMTLWRWIKKGDFPQAIKQNGRTYWVAGEVQGWIVARSRARGTR